MSVEVVWDFPALAAFYEVPWPASADVDAAVLRFAEGRAKRMESGRYRIRAAGYEVAVRLDRRAGTVLVLYVSTIS
jgi:hypothetical protein